MGWVVCSGVEWWAGGTYSFGWWGWGGGWGLGRGGVRIKGVAGSWEMGEWGGSGGVVEEGRTEKDG